MWEQVLHSDFFRRDQPLRDQRPPVYSRRVPYTLCISTPCFLINLRQIDMLWLIPALGALPWAPEPGHVSTGYVPRCHGCESWGLLSAIQTRFSASQLITTYLYRVHVLIIFADMYDIYVTIIRQSLHNKYARRSSCASALPPK